MSSPLLALATGVLSGALTNRQKKKQDDAADLDKQLKLLETPGVSLEPTGVRSALDVAASIAGGQTPGGIAAGPGGGTAPGQSAGTAQLGGKSFDVRFDPSQTPTGRKAAQDVANRAAHGRLQKIDPTLWNGTFDPAYDYTGAERDEQKKSQMESELVAGGWDKTRARLIARTGFDPDKRDAEIEAKKNAGAARSISINDSNSRAADSKQARELKELQQTEKDAHDTALGWAQNAKTVTVQGKNLTDDEARDQIAEGLAAMYPKLTYAQRVGVAAKAMMARDAATAANGAKNRSGVPKPGARTNGLRIPGVPGVVIPPAKSGDTAIGKPVAAGPPANTGSAAAATAKVNGDRVKQRQKAIDELVDAGKTKEEIRAELKRRGLS